MDSTIAVMLVSCAQIAPLTGGEKDIDAPKELKSSPINGSTNFSEKTIVVEFDEFIKLNNVTNQFIVSPPMETLPEITVKGKKLMLKLKSKLAPTTTYSLNFGNAIADITENNVFPNYKYVFSTGSYIDSLAYSGTVINAFDQTPKAGVYVLLYDQFEDSVPLKELPKYVALTNKAGKFSITNIANGSYKLFAINDINGNYLFDLPNEAIGFKNNKIVMDSSSTANIIYLFEEENALQYMVKSEHKTYGKIELILNKPTKQLSITPLNKPFNEALENWSIIKQNNLGDSLTIWLYSDAMKGIKTLDLQVKDGSKAIDTINFELIPQSMFKDSTLLVTSNIANTFHLNKNIFLTFNRPFTKYDPNNIKLYEDSVLVTTTCFSGVDTKKFELAYDFKENTYYQLFIPPNTFKGIYGLTNDTIQHSFTTKKEADYGIINLNINPNFSKNYIVQLFKKKQLFSENYFTGKQTQQYKYLSPGVYELKLIVDNNGDNKWTTGIYLTGIQPEKVIIYNKTIEVKANWDNAIDWSVKE